MYGGLWAGATSDLNGVNLPGQGDRLMKSRLKRRHLRHMGQLLAKSPHCRDVRRIMGRGHIRSEWRKSAGPGGSSDEKPSQTPPPAAHGAAFGEKPALPRCTADYGPGPHPI